MHVFVYGTLTEPDTAAGVLDSFVYTGPAVLEGMHAVSGRYPTLAPGGRVGGRVLRTHEVDALDAYEGLDRGLYVRVCVPATDDVLADAGGERDADADAADGVAVYVGDPSALGADATWPGDGSFRERVERYVADRDVRVDSAAARGA
jgi:gamma-glutamylcyclotransferase (GGCT)/AIG2-like uncharacterized protein YtfP